MDGWLKKVEDAWAKLLNEETVYCGVSFLTKDGWESTQGLYSEKNARQTAQEGSLRQNRLYRITHNGQVVAYYGRGKQIVPPFTGLETFRMEDYP